MKSQKKTPSIQIKVVRGAGKPVANLCCSGDQ